MIVKPVEDIKKRLRRSNMKMKSPINLNVIRHQTGLTKIVSRFFVSWEGVFYDAFNHPQTFMSTLKQRFNIHKNLGSGHILKKKFRLPLPKRHCFRSVTTGYHPKTIFSLSSGHGKCGVAVIRISGSKVKDVISKMMPISVKILPRKAVLSKIIDPETKLPIDKGLVLYFPGPSSFTGEDCLEFQVHGGPAVISAVLSALYKIPDCRQAEPGEFTKRAFLNGKLDLTEVEGLGDLIHAETEVQRKQALRQMEGDLSQLYSRWRQAFIKCVADLEAFIDFSEDQHIGEEVTDRVIHMVKALREEIRSHINDKRQGERLREGVHVTILGEPNVGKSSLLNAICQRPAAIVTEIAGTTRDIIETPVNIDGYPVLLSDTAGLRETQDLVEKEGVIRAINRAKKSDIRIFMIDCSQYIDQSDLQNKNVDFRLEVWTTLDRLLNENKLLYHEKCINIDNRETMKNVPISDLECDISEDIKIEHDNTIILLNKIDLLQNDVIDSLKMQVGVTSAHESVLIEETTQSHRKEHDHRKSDLENCGKFTDSLNSNNIKDLRIASSFTDKLTVCCISCMTGAGMDNFINVLRDKVANMCGNPLVGHPSITQTRHRSHLIMCLENLDKFEDMMTADDIVLASEYLRRALREMGKITGTISSEEILDVIFKDFCIGK